MNQLSIKFIFIATILAIATACSNSKVEEPQYTINLELANSQMDSVYLFILNTDGWDLIDSVGKIDDKFTFTGEFKSPEYISIGDKKRNYSVRLLAGNSSITILSDFDNPQNDSIQGATFNDDYIAIQKNIMKFDEQLGELASNYRSIEFSGDSIQIKNLELEYDSLTTVKNDWVLNWVKENPNNVVSEILIINPLMYSLSFEELKELFVALSPDISKNGMYHMIEDRVTTLEKSAVGTPAPNITMVDTNSVVDNLHAHFGTYLLIDFWASWCGPCRMDNPQMVGIFNRFHEKGYNVFGVSLDSKEDQWKKAINDDKLFWTHVSDLKGWQSEGAKSYGITSIPHTVLIDPEGIIIARGLSPDELEAKLESLLLENN